MMEFAEIADAAAGTHRESPALQDLRSYDPEYVDVKELFLRHACGKDFHLEITSIQKVAKGNLYSKFQIKEQEYKEKFGKVQIYKLFHGTDKSSIPSILEKNLEVERYGQKTGHLFGNGVSFSALSTYSSHYCDKNEDEKQMLLFYVLVSNIIEMPACIEGYSYSQLPFIEGKWPLRYDTTTKTKGKMDVVIKNEDHTFYPAYIINFKKIFHLEPQSMRMPNNDFYPLWGYEKERTPEIPVECIPAVNKYIYFHRGNGWEMMPQLSQKDTILKEENAD